MDALPATFYGEVDKKNPVVCSFEGELKEVTLYIKRAVSLSKPDHQIYSKGSKTLFDIYNKYRPRLPGNIYLEKVVQIANFLFDLKVYRLALWQGYHQYFCWYNPSGLHGITDVTQFQTLFLPDGFSADHAVITFNALQGYCLSAFYVEMDRDEHLSLDGVHRLRNLLTLLQVMMEILLPHEDLAWLLYNGTLHVYTICRLLMSAGHFTEAIEPLLWACVSLETSLPLLHISLLPWRATLYCAVCQCYYQCNEGSKAEAFAERALSKVKEVMIFNETSSKNDTAYREARVKLSAMIFKRTVIEARKKLKILRTKERRTISEVHTVPWPCSITETLLMEAFEGHSAQFLAITEALWDTSHKPLQTRVPVDANIMEVLVDLLIAGVSILAGVGGSSERVKNEKSILPNTIQAIQLSVSPTLLELASAGKNWIPINAAVKFVKLLFLYEQWDTFTSLSKLLIPTLKQLEGPALKEELELTLLLTMEPLINVQKYKRPVKSSGTGRGTEDSVQVMVPAFEDLMAVMETIHSIVCDPNVDIQPFEDFVMDIVIFLWEKFKMIFHMTQSESPDHTVGLENHIKWIQSLYLFSQMSRSCDLAFSNPSAAAEITLQLANVLESTVDPESKSPTAEQILQASFSLDLQLNMPDFVKKSATEQLQEVLDLVNYTLDRFCNGRARFLPSDGSAICDTVHLQQCTCSTSASPGGEPVEAVDSRDRSMLACLHMDLHVELLVVQYRVSLKLRDIYPESDLLEKIGKNKISKALFLMQKALLDDREDNVSARKILEDAFALIEKAEVEERRMASAVLPNVGKGGIDGKLNVPPPPIVLLRSDTAITFTPAPYVLNKQVHWYCLFGREATGFNLKVRLGDTCLPGTGEEVPYAEPCVLRVCNLEPNQTYMFAVAAYDAAGQLVGGAIGESTRPLLASIPLPLLSTWAHLVQVAYQIGVIALVKKSCCKLLGHFTHMALAQPGTQLGSEGFSHIRLCPDALQNTCPILHKLFLNSLFMHTDVQIEEKALFCDNLSDGGPLIWGQVARLAQCEYMLVAMDVALRIKDNGAILQTVVVCYGLLAPIIYHRIPCDAVIQVLVKCLSAFQEIPAVLKRKYPPKTMEPVQHMIACITYYVTKLLRLSERRSTASATVQLGKEILQEMMNANRSNKLVLSEVFAELCHIPSAEEINIQLRVLEAVVRLDRKGFRTLLSKIRGTQVRVTNEDPVVMYTVVHSSPIQMAYKEVMKMKQSPVFLEMAVLLLQRGVREEVPNVVLQWGKELLTWLRGSDDVLTGKKKTPLQELKKYSVAALDYSKKPKMSIAVPEKESPKKKQFFAITNANSEREYHAMEELQTGLARLVSRWKRRNLLRLKCSEEQVWRCHLNLSLAQCHLAMLRRSVAWGSFATSRQGYSHLDPWLFSLAHTGVLVRRNGPVPVQVPKRRAPVTPPKAQTPVKEVQSSCSNTESEDDTPRTPNTPDSEPVESTRKRSVFTGQRLPDSLVKAATHFRRAMVLAHRGASWTSLQWACHIVWDQTIAITQLVEQRHSIEMRNLFYSLLTPLLALAADLLLDMMHRLKLWAFSEEEDGHLEGSLHFSTPADEVRLLDLRWVKSLCLRAMELLYFQGNWESLAHLALVFNTITRERYTDTVTPLLIYAQRELLERREKGGPALSNFTLTEKVTGEKVTCRNYLEMQQQSGWSTGKGLETHDMVETEQALALVSVPLDVQDTLRCFRESLGRDMYASTTLRHSRSLLLLLLASTQPDCLTPFCQEGRKGQKRVDFHIHFCSRPSIIPPDLSTQDFRSPDTVCPGLLAPSQLQTVISSYISSIKYLQANKQNSLSVQALHELGNLQYYRGNKRASLSCWNKALDCILQCSGVLDSWDGVSWGNRQGQDILREAGIWGCLQGALLAAKIAQYHITSNFRERTNCCLLSALLFKSLLRASLPHPQCDWQYSSYTIDPELIPGLDLFSDPHRAHIGTTVASLSFLCHWLYLSGHFLTTLPLLSLYLYLTTSVCRDKRRTIEGRILKMKVLTELFFYTHAMTQLESLIQGEKLPQPDGTFLIVNTHLEKHTFYTTKAILEPVNMKVVDELLNLQVRPELEDLLGLRLTQKLNMAIVQLICALCRSLRCLPEAEIIPPVVDEEEDPFSEADTDIPEVHLVEEPPTPGRVKDLLLTKASEILISLMDDIQSHPVDAEELEIAVESRMLLADIYLQRIEAIPSADLTACALQLIQDSPLLRTKGGKEERPSNDPDDHPHVVEASERLGALWLRCRWALVKALASHIPGSAILPGADSSKVAGQVLMQALEETESWDEPDARALLLLQGVRMHMHQGKPKEESISLLQEAVSLLSGTKCLSQRASLTLVTATLHLSDLRGKSGRALHLLTQKLLQQQLAAVGELISITEAGQVVLHSPVGIKNRYLPQILLLASATLRLGQCLALQAADSTDTNSSQWVTCWDVLQSALQVCHVSASQDTQLETDLLYCRGLLEAQLAFIREFPPQRVLDTFLDAIRVAQSNVHDLRLIRRCYLEMARVYLWWWQSAAEEETLFHFWVCLRAAAQVTDVCARRSQPCRDAVDLPDLQDLPEFLCNDLLIPCGGLGKSYLESEINQIKWIHLTRYHSRLLNLHHISTRPAAPQCFEELCSVSVHGSVSSRLTGLQQVFSSHLPDYGDLCCIPAPPGCLLHADPDQEQPLASEEEPPEVVEPPSPWPCADKEQELCMQWHQPALDPPLQQTQNTVVLLFGFSHSLLSALQPPDSVQSELQCGQLRAPLDRLQDVHSQLCALCAEADVCPTASLFSTHQSTRQEDGERNNEESNEEGEMLDQEEEEPLGQEEEEPQGQEEEEPLGQEEEEPLGQEEEEPLGQEEKEPLDQNLQALQKHTLHCLDMITSFLHPTADPAGLTEVPFEPSIQKLRELEKCFKPRGGGVVSGDVAVWLVNLLNIAVAQNT